MKLTKEQEAQIDEEMYRRFWETVFFRRLEANKEKLAPIQDAADDADRALDALRERKTKFVSND